ncbi:DUF2793 domain-containing protein [Pseudochelatococcus lubricantis]|uniref:DUF2793 domain-containing protein n=1 Tax=Pseudochelatococcus lubricantis TaxID=1538102 RepID=UPI0035E4888E
MSETTKLRLPLLAAAQAQKHVTHNEALLKLDALLHLEVIDRDLAAPPPGPADGDRYIVAAGASGAWAGEDGHVAVWQDGVWRFHVPQTGWRAYVRDEGALCVKADAGWLALGAGGGALQNLTLFGLGTQADAENPFAAKIGKALWTARTVAEGGTGDLRYTFNKEAAANVLSLLFQRNWSGRAEMGLIGSDDLQVKVSADGATWREALRIDRATGRATFSQGIAPRAWVTLTDAATVAIDAAAGDKFRLTASGTRTLGKPTNLTDGVRFLLRVINSAATTLTLNAAYAPLSGSVPALRTGAGQGNTFDCVYDAAADKIFYAWY